MEYVDQEEVLRQLVKMNTDITIKGKTTNRTKKGEDPCDSDDDEKSDLLLGYLLMI
jgi:hypothetical protein